MYVERGANLVPEKKSRVFGQRLPDGLILGKKRGSRRLQTDPFGPIGGTRSDIFSPFAIGRTTY